MSEEPLIQVDEEEAVEFIQNKLISKGELVLKRDIVKILDLYYEFLIEKGIAKQCDEDD